MNCRGKQLAFGQRTLVMGVVNVTPDSFSDGGQFATTESAIVHGLKLVDEGADILDVGGESARPGAKPVALEEELRRVLPVIEALAAKTSVPISIDTYKPIVAQKGLETGAHIVNDITALRDPEMAGVIAATGAGVILMHMKGTPQTMQKAPSYRDVVSEILAFLQQRVSDAHTAGIAPERIIVDPGIGFGKSTQDNLELLRRLSEFRSLGKPVLIGTSRKSFIGKILDVPNPAERLAGTAATVAWAISRGADIIRVHDVSFMRQVARMTDVLHRQQSQVPS